jgi:hypothetical protein
MPPAGEFFDAFAGGCPGRLPGGTTGCDFGAADLADGVSVPGVFTAGFPELFVTGGCATLFFALLSFVEVGAVFEGAGLFATGGATGCITGPEEDGIAPGDPDDAPSSVVASDARTCPAT